MVVENATTSVLPNHDEKKTTKKTTTKKTTSSNKGALNKMGVFEK